MILTCNYLALERHQHGVDINKGMNLLSNRIFFILTSYYLSSFQSNGGLIRKPQNAGNITLDERRWAINDATRKFDFIMIKEWVGDSTLTHRRSIIVLFTILLEKSFPLLYNYQIRIQHGARTCRICCRDLRETRRSKNTTYARYSIDSLIFQRVT